MSEEILDGVKIGQRFFPFVRITESMQPKIIKKLTRLNWRAVLWNRWKQKARNKYISGHPLKSYEEKVKAYLAEHPKEKYTLEMAAYKDLILNGLVYSSPYQQMREWKIIRSVAFQKNFWWKYFRIIPYELRCNVIETKDSRPIKKKFDNYLMEMTRGQSEQSSLPTDSQTKSTEIKSGT